jgi:hypothetical protein
MSLRHVTLRFQPLLRVSETVAFAIRLKAAPLSFLSLLPPSRSESPGSSSSSVMCFDVVLPGA